MIKKHKEIQEKRMKEYFIQATKEILKSEGLKSLSVRNIADRAGYSYATLYHYFKDANELIFHCINDFQAECEEFAKNKVKEIPEGKERLKTIIIGYINYFLEYPGIFDLFYIEKMGDIGNKQTTLAIIANSFDNLCQPSWEYFKNQQKISAEKIENLKSLLHYTVIGLLLLYLNRMIPALYKDFMTQVNNQINNILENGLME